MVEQLRWWAYERQRLGRAAPDAKTALSDVVAVYSSHPTAPLALHARAKKLDAAAFRRLAVLRLPAMRKSIHLMPRATAHLPFRALPEPAADGARRLKNFKLSEKRYEELRAKVRAAAEKPASLQELREATGAEAKELKGATAQMTRTGELVRVGAAGLRSNELRYVAADIEEADADEALAWLAGEYLRAFGPVRAEGLHLVVGRGRQARQGGARGARHRGARRRAADPHRRTARRSRRPSRARAPSTCSPSGTATRWATRPTGATASPTPTSSSSATTSAATGGPVILVDGEAAGTWERLEVDLFEKATPKVRKAIDERIEAVKAFLS